MADIRLIPLDHVTYFKSPGAYMQLAASSCPIGQSCNGSKRRWSLSVVEWSVFRWHRVMWYGDSCTGGVDEGICWFKNRMLILYVVFSRVDILMEVYAHTYILS